MSKAPVHNIDPKAFWHDPYPSLAQMRANTPICYVPQLDAVLLTRRDDIFANEKKVEVFSSYQPDGLMVQLMGENLMRKDGEAHLKERRILFAALSPRVVKETWRPVFTAATRRILDDLENKASGDLVKEYAMPVSAEALKAITGLTNMTAKEMDWVSQGMIDGCANYAGDPAIEENCHDCTRSIDAHIDDMRAHLQRHPNPSVLSVQLQAGLPMDSIRANVKLVISGGQNEPRDAIAGAIWALLTHPDQRHLIETGAANWHQAFEEYARWISPIGMSPRRIAKQAQINGIAFEPEARCFLMFSSGNRDEAHFDHPDEFDITRDISASVTFGSGPHFCAGAAAAKTLIADIALPQFFSRFPKTAFSGTTRFGGWAFRGPLEVPCEWG